MFSRVAIISVSIAMLTVAVSPNAMGASPGDPCTKEGEVADLSGGKIACVGGVWQPQSTGTPAPEGGTPAPGGDTPAPSSGSTAPPIKTAAIFKTIGPVLSPATFASTSQQVADATSVLLADGRIRLYAFVSPEGILSAISTNAKGTKFTAEPGRRITWAPGGQTRAVSLPNGDVRLFYIDNGNINSAISTDGLTFTDEGVRILGADAGFEPGVLTVVKVGSSYRGYFSNLEKPGEMKERIARTATSPDMLTWTVGPYVAGSEGSIKDGASHPFAITKGKTIALYYNGDRSGWYGLLRSTSTDGVTFSNERAILQGAGDPQLQPITGGKTLLYTGGEITGKGFGILVARATVSPVTGESTKTKKK